MCTLAGFIDFNDKTDDHLSSALDSMDKNIDIRGRD